MSPGSRNGRLRGLRRRRFERLIVFEQLIELLYHEQLIELLDREQLIELEQLVIQQLIEQLLEQLEQLLELGGRCERGIRGG